ncbi:MULTISPECIES: inorganic phosphate transporter [unclassified Campylobacter]|uniref:inorganic phosphate transporter n=1 Tax=unclassified Campylobacter TaxID=2593542 RepID=UPI0022E9C5FE|nr:MULTISPECIES: inorganic phosphate transporter [unclassified Campylobacter]MDA3043094.1 inorganic phosphate transporter [Campylobacter sp. JMF_09 ED2]MDA3044869.1 inorganic phosphate transporter [Campylobacter sp. JMF_07 ED4]MDA3063045.1 inorganic phosphate transporter [Campylobacter sp. JMF_14 EL1]MDA3063905.1 inorganic phosphate transporter [Campylobacter sp. JMF_11 EL3]MDA3072694.1 inorganic phosphate transporter [Campylobacter sp. JMF_10 EL2]
MKTQKINLLLIGITLGALIYFFIWGFGFIGNANKLIFVISVFLGVFMAFNIGGNDVANSFGTSVGSGTLTITQALCIAAVFEASGAIIAGGEVTASIRSGIIDFGGSHIHPSDFIYIMMSALFAAGAWLLFASKHGLPVSTTHAIVGGIVGSGVTLGFLMNNPEISALSLVQWGKIGKIASSWVLSPLLGGLISYGVFWLIKHYILDYNKYAQIRIDRIKREKKALRKLHKKTFETLDDIQKIAYAEAVNHDIYAMKDPDFDPSELDSDYYKKIVNLDRKKEGLKSHRALEFGIPAVAGIGAFVISSMLIFKGLQNLDLGLSDIHNYLIIGMVTVVTWLLMFIFAKTLRRSDLHKSTFLMFSWLQVLTACGFAFSHGSNDIANAVGPFAAILDTLASGSINGDSPVPPQIMVMFAVALIVGLWFVGKEVIATVGTNLTEIHPASGFSAELASAIVVMVASVLGLPISSTHVLIGAILGIGVVNGNTNWSLMKPIGLAWIITLPASSLLAAVMFIVLRHVI